MSGAVEGVALRKIIRDMLDGKAGARDAARQVLTAPPARSYADGVEDAAKVAENLCADMTVEANAETASLTSTLHRASAQTAGKIAAAIRLLSQGGKA